MPLATIMTNINLSEPQRKALLQSLSGQVAELLGKPEQYVMTAYQYNPDMLFGGSDQPLAYMELKSIGLPADETGHLSQALCTEIGKLTGIPSNRIYIEFNDAARNMWGWDQRTFAG